MFESELTENRLVRNVSIVEEIEEHCSLGTREKQNEIVLISVDGRERFLRSRREHFDFVRTA